MNITDIAYAAGAIDADGCFTIKLSTQRVRLANDCVNAAYRPRVSLGQVTPAVPFFLKEMFGGSVRVANGCTPNSKPIHRWMVGDRTAYETAKVLLHYLKIKAERAACLIELHELRSRPGVRQLAYWYAIEHPNWKEEPLLTTREVMGILGYSSGESVAQAIANGTLLCAHPGRHGRKEVPKIPYGLVHQLSALHRGRNRYFTAPQLVAAMHTIYERLRGINTLGINGTCVNFRTGYFVLK